MEMMSKEQADALETASKEVKKIIKQLGPANLQKNLQNIRKVLEKRVQRRFAELGYYDYAVQPLEDMIMFAIKVHKDHTSFICNGFSYKSAQ